MKTPLASGSWEEVDAIASTQAECLSRVAANIESAPGVLFARHQTAGVGRFDRKWYSEPASSLTMSLVFRDYPNHSEPWLIGMAVACAAAGVVHSRLKWPNDLMLDEKKLGGVLTQIATASNGDRIAVVGVGINLEIIRFPDEIAQSATSLALHHDGLHDAKQIAIRILERIEILPEPESWENLKPVWSLFDQTPGTKYRLLSGEEAIGIGIGPHAELIASVDGETQSVMAAEALLGTT